MIRVGIIVGSTRPGRKAAAVAEWAYDILQSRKDAEFEIIDIEDYKLPLLDEPVPPSMRQYSKTHTKTWSAKINSLDAFIFVTAPARLDRHRRRLESGLHGRRSGRLPRHRARPARTRALDEPVARVHVSPGRPPFATTGGAKILSRPIETPPFQSPE
jgi:hypothetical protein